MSITKIGNVLMKKKNQKESGWMTTNISFSKSIYIDQKCQKTIQCSLVLASL